MSLDILSKEIIEQAQKEKESFSSQIALQMSDLEKEFETRLDKFKSDFSSKNSSELSYQKSKIIGSYKRDAKHLVLDVKARILKEAFDLTLQKLISLRGEQRKDILSKLVKLAESQIEFEKVYCARKDIKHLKELVSSDIKITSQEDIEGLIFEANSGKEIVDLTFMQFLKEIFENNEDTIQKRLFDY